jgi:hypothetical protein
MTAITDEFMKQTLPKAKQYVICILKAGPKINQLGVEKIIWEHGRRNFQLHADDVLCIVCPVTDESDVRGVGIFNAGIEEVKKIMDEDPGVKTGCFIYELHSCRSFQGDSLK